MKRSGVGKKLRFEVFERDSFLCQYCGRTPTEDGVVLHVDHVVSVKNGGNDSLENLTTSCIDCNLGKGAKTTIKKGNTPKEIQEQLDRTKERLEQVVAMNSAMKKLSKMNKDIEEQLYSWVPYVLGDGYSEAAYTTVKKVLGSKKYNTVLMENKQSAVEILSKKMQKFSTVEDMEKYLKGIMRNIELSDSESAVLMRWIQALKGKGARVFPFTRQIILDNALWGEEFHEHLIGVFERGIDKHNGQCLKAHDKAVEYTKKEQYVVYRSGDNLNYLACDVIGLEAAKEEAEYAT